jgi:hypothetical protein
MTDMRHFLLIKDATKSKKSWKVMRSKLFQPSHHAYTSLHWTLGDWQKSVSTYVWIGYPSCCASIQGTIAGPRSTLYSVSASVAIDNISPCNLANPWIAMDMRTSFWLTFSPPVLSILCYSHKLKREEFGELDCGGSISVRLNERIIPFLKIMDWMD